MAGSLQRANLPPNSWTPYDANMNISRISRIDTYNTHTHIRDHWAQSWWPAGHITSDYSTVFARYCLQCFDTVGWAQGRASRSVKIEWWGVGMVICLERGADYLHMVQLIPLYHKTPSWLASFKSRSVLPFWYWLNQVVMEKRPLNGCSSSSSIRQVTPMCTPHVTHGSLHSQESTNPNSILTGWSNFEGLSSNIAEALQWDVSPKIALSPGGDLNSPIKYGSLGQPEFTWHLNQFSLFCRAHNVNIPCT